MKALVGIAVGIGCFTLFATGRFVGIEDEKSRNTLNHENTETSLMQQIRILENNHIQCQIDRDNAKANFQAYFDAHLKLLIEKEKIYGSLTIAVSKVMVCDGEQCMVSEGIVSVDGDVFRIVKADASHYRDRNVRAITIDSTSAQFVGYSANGENAIYLVDKSE